MPKPFSNPWDKEYSSETTGTVYEPLWKLVSAQLAGSFGKVIDFGCGDGTYSFLLKNLGFEVIGIDFSAKAIQLATRIRDERMIEGVDFVVDNTIPGFIASDSVDIVMLLNSYHCLEGFERKLLLNSARRVLSQEGMLILSVLSMTDESYPRNKWDEIGENSYKDEMGKFFHFFYKDELVSELQSFKIIDIEVLENIHPDIGRKSSLYVVTAIKR